MSFQSQTATTFVRLNLTDLGRQKMALGTFRVNQVVFSDREMQYDFNRRYPVGDVKFANMNPTSNALYDVEQNKVISPACAAPGLPPRNFDGTSPYQINDRLVVSTQILTARTESRGLWSAVTSGSNQNIGQYIVDVSKAFATGQTKANGMLGLQYVTPFGGSAVLPGYFAYLRASTEDGTFASMDSDAPHRGLWYKVNGGFPGYGFDRRVAQLNSVGLDNYPIYFYPNSATTQYWNSGSTSPGEVWSLNIVRTSPVIGTEFPQGVSGYTSYGSKEFAGTRRYFGFDREQRAIGFVWHQDNFTGNTYGDLLMPNTTQLDLPDLMWHRKRGALPGIETKTGHRFTDAAGGILFDEIAQTNYTELKDGTDPNAIVVGRVYYELKVIVITDQELLTAMSYKSNRNYTLPPLNVELSSTHPSGSTVTGMIQEGYTYYFTYYMRNDTPYNAGTSYGWRHTSPCAYWTEVVGKNQPDGSPYFASVSLDPSGFPYMRDETTYISMSGTGWMANQFQIIINSGDTSESGATGADRVRPNQWNAVSNGLSSSTINYDGVYHGESGHANIRPQFLGTRVFNIERSEFVSGVDYKGGSVYTIPGEQSTGLSGSTGLTYGDEVFLNGNVRTTYGLRTEKMIVTVSVNKDELNNSRNGGFDGNKDESTYITEVGLMNDRGELMAVGKPTYPVRKNNARHLLFQLEVNI